VHADAGEGGGDVAEGVRSARAPGFPVATRVEPWQEVQVSVEVSMAPLMCRLPDTRIAPEPFTVVPWQFAQVVSAAALWWLAVVGGDRWQLVQVATAPFQDQVRPTVPRVVVALSEAPWQYVVQVVWLSEPSPSVKPAANPFSFAPVASVKFTSRVLLPWLLVVLFGWHSLQATGLYTPPATVGFTCEACVPTRMPAAAPWLSTGGAEAWLAS
jgi:hypothetical protein